MADTQILASGSASVPESYTVPAGQEIVLKTVSGQFDGTGAAGAWVPTLEIDNGSAAGPWIYPLNTSIASGGTADVTWGPFPVEAASAPASGGVVAAYINRTSTQTFGPSSNHAMLFTHGTFETSDSATFSSPDNFTIELAHGGIVMAGLVGEFGTNGGIAYNGQFEMQTQILDSANTPVDQLMGPDVYASELYATDPGDDFRPNGYSIWNCDDSSFVPPYQLTGSITVNVNVTFIGYGMYCSILSPTGLT